VKCAPRCRGLLGKSRDMAHGEERVDCRKQGQTAILEGPCLLVINKLLFWKMPRTRPYINWKGQSGGPTCRSAPSQRLRPRRYFFHSHSPCWFHVYRGLHFGNALAARVPPTFSTSRDGWHRDPKGCIVSIRLRRRGPAVHGQEGIAGEFSRLLLFGTALFRYRTQP
jgi:hypothetical protein